MRSELRLLLFFFFFRAQTTAYIVDKAQHQKGGTKVNAIIMVIVCVFVRVMMDVIDIQEGRV